MSLLFVVGLGIWLIAEGVGGLPQMGMTATIGKIVGGILVLVSAFV